MDDTKEYIADINEPHFENSNQSSIDENENKNNKLTLEERRIEFRKRCLHWHGTLGHMTLSFNPLTTILAALMVWLIIAWALLDGNSSEYLLEVKAWITETWTWLFIVAEVLFTLLVFVIYFKFGHLKLGKDYDKPEFNDFSYFAMVFTCGLAIAMFYSGVSDPIGYYNEPGDGLIFWSKNNLHSRAQNAMNITIFHWGLHGYAVYIAPALLISILTHRKGLPLTMRTCFYPIFGRRIFGRLGDVVDTLSILCVIFGVSTSLSLGSIILNTGINKLNNDIKIKRDNQIIIIWGLTTVATMSVISGLKIGIRRLSEVCFLTGFLLLTVVVLSDNTWFVLNVFVQSVGYYFQFIIGTGAHTGAFAQTDNIPNQQGKPEWMHENTIFYWAWQISWVPLVSMFIARVSKGRTVGNVLLYSYFLPTCCLFFWLTSFGGIAINMENVALKANITCDMYVNSDTRNASYYHVWKTVDETVVLLSCKEKYSQFFDVLNKYVDISTPLHVLSIISIIFYFSTSSDSASLVVDSISSNGEENPPLAQRVFWALTEGAAATALLFYNSPENQEALKSFAVIIGLPFVLFIGVTCLSLWRVLKKEPSWQLDLDGEWKMHYGNINSQRLMRKVLLAAVAPWYYLGDILIMMNQCRYLKNKLFCYLQFLIPCISVVCLIFLRILYKNADNFGWAFLLCIFAYSANIRMKIRNNLNINRRKGCIIAGNIVEDILAMVLYPLTIVQMHEELVGEDLDNTDEIEICDDIPSSYSNKLCSRPNEIEEFQC